MHLASALRVRHGIVTREYNRFNKLYLAAARSDDDDLKRYGGSLLLLPLMSQLCFIQFLVWLLLIIMELLLAYA